jgi:hypothetical protein
MNPTALSVSPRYEEFFHLKKPARQGGKGADDSGVRWAQLSSAPKKGD